MRYSYVSEPHCLDSGACSAWPELSFFLPLIPPLKCKTRFIMTRMSSIYQKLGLKPSTPPFHAYIQLGNRLVINLLKASLAHSPFF